MTERAPDSWFLETSVSFLSYSTCFVVSLLWISRSYFAFSLVEFLLNSDPELSRADVMCYLTPRTQIEHRKEERRNRRSGGLISGPSQACPSTSGSTAVALSAHL